MIHLHIECAYFGAVQPVAETVIHTRFLSVTSFPVWPMDSGYYGRCRYHDVALPLDGSVQTEGDSHPEYLLIPARRMILSIIAAYARAFAAAAILLGVIPLFVIGVMAATGERSDIPLLWIAIPSATAIGAGALVGALSYPLFSRVSSRQRAIRLAAREVYGIAHDPARMFSSDAASWIETLEREWLKRRIVDLRQALANPESLTPEIQRLLLMRCRLELACGGDRRYWEHLTDRLLVTIPEGRELKPPHISQFPSPVGRG